MREETEFILQCKPNSFIEQVMYSKASLDTSGFLNQPLLFCLTPESLENGKRFLEDIRWKGKAENFPLALMLAGRKHHFTFSGVQLRDHLILVAQHTPETHEAETTQVTEDLIAEEVAEALKATETAENTGSPNKEAPELEDQREVTVWDLMEEMSRLNNELINTKRELVRKNMELERLQQQLKKG